MKTPSTATAMTSLLRRSCAKHTSWSEASCSPSWWCVWWSGPHGATRAHARDTMSDTKVAAAASLAIACAAARTFRALANHCGALRQPAQCSEPQARFNGDDSTVRLLTTASSPPHETV
jgi:hypothetical protein